MSPSLLFWVAAAALLFWSVGAYNRLVRLRSEANTAFIALEIELTRQVQLVQSFLPAQDDQAAGQDGDSVFWTSLGGAASQFAASLAAARNRPLEREGIEALGAAQDVLATAWERAERLLNAFSYREVLKRGFALVRDGDGLPLRAAAGVSSGMRLDIEFADGRVAATADGEGSPRDRAPPPVVEVSAVTARPKPRAKGGGEGSGGQGSLFG